MRNIQQLGAIAVLLAAASAFAQNTPTEPGARALSETVKLSFEVRSRVENRNGPAFGKDPDLTGEFVRTRVGVTWKAASWITLSGLAQDARAPFYGEGAPGTARDPVDLQEGYAEFLPNRKTGLGVLIGRQMLQYGDSRLIGSPQWAYTARTYDTVRLYYRIPGGRFELLFVSPIKPRGDGFNTPVLGDRAWGMYNAFEKLGHVSALDVYVLRHHQNRPGGFTGTGRLQTNTFGSRVSLPGGPMKWTGEGAFQTGKIGPSPHRAGAFVIQAARRLEVFDRPLDVSAEYKFASGTKNVASGRSNTFDQLYPAGHDKLGHMDMLGWRNIHNAKAVASLNLTRQLTVSLMYNNSWLASEQDGVYNLQGKLIVRKPGAGSHVGQEADIFATYKKRWWMLGAGYGYFFPGEFIRNALPPSSPSYLYATQAVNF